MHPNVINKSLKYFESLGESMIRTTTCSYCQQDAGINLLSKDGSGNNVSQCKGCGACFDGSYYYDEVYKNHQRTPEADEVRDIGV